MPGAAGEDQSTESAVVPVNPVDPLKDVIAELEAEIAAEQGAGVIDYYGVVDPLAEDMKAIDQELGVSYWIRVVSLNRACSWRR